MRGIVPRKIKGFRDIDPELNQLRWKIIHGASRIYRLYGFEQWDTPVLEYADCLGKYLPDTDTVQEGVYSFQNPELEPVLQADGKELRDEQDHTVMEHHFVTLRYDLTAPLARHYAENLWIRHLRGQINPQRPPLFRRYQYGPVFRYEAKLDPGRFREFWQLDFDSVGTDDPAADAEVAMILADALEAIGLTRGSYIVKVNNRKILQALLAGLNITGEEAEQAVLRVIDKKDKIELRGVEEELACGRVDPFSGAQIPGLGLEKITIREIISFLEKFAGSRKRIEILKNLEQSGKGSDLKEEGLREMRQMDEVLTSLGFDEERVLFDPTLVRGMAYYTGPVFEVDSRQTFIDDKGRQRQVGSICGGGRYDGLVENLLGLKVPATGASIGVDRLAELLVLTGQHKKDSAGPVLITVFDNALMAEYQKVAQQLRQENVDVEVYYGFQRGLKKQLSYADQKNSPLAILVGEDEIKKGVVTIRDLRLGDKISAETTNKEEWKKRAQFEVPRTDMIKTILDMI